MQRIISMHFQASILIDLNGMINYDINISYRKHTYNLLRIHRILLLQSLPIVLINFYGLVLCKMNISYRKLNSKSDNSLNAIRCINFDWSTRYIMKLIFYTENIFLLWNPRILLMQSSALVFDWFTRTGTLSNDYFFFFWF